VVLFTSIPAPRADSPQPGTRDLSFNSVLAPGDGVYALGLQPDGKILIGGTFTNIHGASRRTLARLNPDGSLDDTFNAGDNAIGANIFGVNWGGAKLVPQDDGKILVANVIRTVNGVQKNTIARLNSDGTADSTFSPAALADSTGAEPSGTLFINSVAIQKDGRYLVVGDFSSIGGVARQGFARLNTDGTVDGGLVVTSYGVATAQVQADGKLLIGGSRFEINGSTVTNLARLSPDGTLDPSFT